ncbi:MAG: hypothetical protein ABIL09_13790 [Gemmatimonadota bacterium]
MQPFISPVNRVVGSSTTPHYGQTIVPFHYPSTTQDLVDGHVMQIALGTSTYGLGRSVEIATASTPCPYVAGVCDQAVNVDSTNPLNEYGFSSTTYRQINVVVAGAKADVRTDGSTTAGSAQMISGTAGYATDMTATNEHNVFGVALETDTTTGTISADMMIDCLRWAF